MTSTGGNAHPAEWLHGNGVMVWRRVYSGRLDQVAQARAWSATLLGDTGRVDDAVLVVTELASNALRFTRSGEPRGWFGVELSRGDHLRIAVRDLGGGCRIPLFPATTKPVLDYPPVSHGYGLGIVADLATQTGIDGTSATGRTIWALLAL